MTEHLVSLDKYVRRLCASLRGVRTPLVRAPFAVWLGMEQTNKFWLKAESLQPIGSFKLRARRTDLQLTPDEIARGVITFSSGTMRRGAYAGVRFGAKA